MAFEKPFSEVRKMLERAGFRLVRISGSHHYFTKPGDAAVLDPRASRKGQALLCPPSRKSLPGRLIGPSTPPRWPRPEKSPTSIRSSWPSRAGTGTAGDWNCRTSTATAKPSANAWKIPATAFAGWVAYLLEEGHKPPTPAQAGMRTAQVNVRLTAEEKVLLETTAKQKGFQGLSDFVRAAALELAK